MNHIHFLSDCMNLDEAVDLLRIISAIPLKGSAKRPEIRIVRAIGEVMSKGYTLRIDKKPVNVDYLNHLNKMAQSKNVAIHESKLCLIIHRKSALCSL